MASNEQQTNRVQLLRRLRRGGGRGRGSGHAWRYFYSEHLSELSQELALFPSLPLREAGWYMIMSLYSLLSIFSTRRHQSTLCATKLFNFNCLEMCGSMMLCVACGWKIMSSHLAHGNSFRWERCNSLVSLARLHGLSQLALDFFVIIHLNLVKPTVYSLKFNFVYLILINCSCIRCSYGFKINILGELN